MLESVTLQSLRRSSEICDDLQRQEKSKPTDSAVAEVASLYYQSSISPSLHCESLSPQKNLDTLGKIETDQPQKSWFGKTKDWLWSLFGVKKEALTESKSSSSERAPSFDAAPRLEPPDFDPLNVDLDADLNEQGRMRKTIAELNQKLVSRLKDIAEFEEEMRKTPNYEADKILFRQLIYSTLYQKGLKEEGSVVAHTQANILHEKYKTTQDEHYDLLDEINARAKLNKALHWTNIGCTVGMVGAMAAAFATGGTSAVLTGGISLMTLAKGATTLSEGVLKYKNDLKTGELFVVGQDLKRTNKKLMDEINVLQAIDEDVGSLIKTIRHHLDNQSRAERAFTNI